MVAWLILGTDLLSFELFVLAKDKKVHPFLTALVWVWQVKGCAL